MEAFKSGADVLFILMGAVMVLAMHSGFAFLEVGTVRTKNQVNGLVKILCDFAISTVAYFFVGYAVAYGVSFFAGAEQLAQKSGYDLVKFFFLLTFAAAVPAIISGGIAEADALGIFGKYGVYLATRWGDPGTFTDAAYRLYLDYDGQGSHFGDVSVSAETSDVAKLPVYAALDSQDPNTLHLVVINRDLTASQTANVTLAGSSEYHSGHAWGFDSSGASLTDRGPVTVSDNGFSLDLPALSAVHVVLATDDPPDISVTPGTGGTGGVGSGSAGQDNGASETSDTDKGGCGCVVASGHSGSFWMLSLFAAALVVLRRRGRRPTTTRSAI